VHIIGRWWIWSPGRKKLPRTQAWPGWLEGNGGGNKRWEGSREHGVHSLSGPGRRGQPSHTYPRGEEAGPVLTLTIIPGWEEQEARLTEKLRRKTARRSGDKGRWLWGSFTIKRGKALTGVSGSGLSP
jgi:hypothetical protein